MPVGVWVSSMAASTLLRCRPPAPEALVRRVAHYLIGSASSKEPGWRGGGSGMGVWYRGLGGGDL